MRCLIIVRMLLRIWLQWPLMAAVSLSIDLPWRVAVGLTTVRFAQDQAARHAAPARVYNWTDDDLKTHERIWIPKAGPTAVDEAVHCRHIAMAKQIGTLSQNAFARLHCSKCLVVEAKCIV